MDNIRFSSPHLGSPFESAWGFLREVSVASYSMGTRRSGNEGGDKLTAVKERQGDRGKLDVVSEAFSGWKKQTNINIIRVRWREEENGRENKSGLGRGKAQVGTEGGKEKGAWQGDMLRIGTDVR